MCKGPLRNHCEVWVLFGRAASQVLVSVSASRFKSGHFSPGSPLYHISFSWVHMLSLISFQSESKEGPAGFVVVSCSYSCFCLLLLVVSCGWLLVVCCWLVCCLLFAFRVCSFLFLLVVACGWLWSVMVACCRLLLCCWIILSIPQSDTLKRLDGILGRAPGLFQLVTRIRKEYQAGKFYATDQGAKPKVGAAWREPTFQEKK